jgi:hypothetical protein
LGKSIKIKRKYPELFLYTGKRRNFKDEILKGGENANP